MKPTLTLLTALLLTAGTAAAQTSDYGQAAAVKIWDNATAPHSNGITSPETEPEKNRIANTSDAVLYIFPADPAAAVETGAANAADKPAAAAPAGSPEKARPARLAVVICPGGGYGRLAMDHEGYEMARWFAARGITAAVLKYRMPNGRWEVPMEDAWQAVRMMKGVVPGAEGFAEERVGIVGFSAGGHLAAMVSTLSDTKPDFSILFYPVITAAEGKSHSGSFDNLLGRERNASVNDFFSLENRVTEETPPTLLLLSDDDRAVSPVNSTRYYNALKEHGVEASMHIYPTGGHGWGFHDSFAYKPQWQQAVLDWLQRIERQ